MSGDYAIDAVCDLLSTHRFGPYLDRADGVAADALQLYEWNARMSATAFETVAHLEVLLRNAVDAVLAEYYDERNRGIPWFLCRPPMDAETSASIDTVRDRLRPLGRDTRHHIVAGLSFGFWSGMLGSKYEDLWRAALRHAFPGSSGARKQVSAQVEAVRKLRNRLAHTDSMLNVDVPFELRRVFRLAEFISPDAAVWLRSIDRAEAEYAGRPHSPVDTVVVGARAAWPFYQEHFAYICQPGRRFQPVERIAFYTDRQVKPDVPRIVHRRDNVPWTAHEEATLTASQDRMDRKVAAVIAAARAAGWREGVYQVFLLTRPGDPRHRRLTSPLVHEVSGTGSAFVRRQRYVSLHALQMASTTADLAVEVGSER